MSYIIAHVAFDQSGNTYPVNCLRTDIKIGDLVLVRMKNRNLKKAKVMDINYLNWECKNTIEFLESELKTNNDFNNVYSDKNKEELYLSSHYGLAVFLYKIGWMPRKATTKMYRRVYSAKNKTQTSIILMRKNGIDVVIFDGEEKEEAKPNSYIIYNNHNDISIRQPLRGSLHNVFERTAHFAKSFLNNENDLIKMIEPIATTKVLPSPPKSEESLYDTLGGCGEPIYLSDGVWLTADGGAHDWGR